MIYAWNLIGHDKLLLKLEKEIAENKLTHAYLFQGPQNTGKFSIALLLGKILLCSDQLCHQCQDCKAVDSGSHPDFIVLKDEGESLKINEVRQLISKTNMTSQGKQRVVVIQHLERMPTEAQNAFLKTLEEPAGNTIFILTSAHPQKILPTIFSRVRSYTVEGVDDQTLNDFILKKGVSETEAKEIVEFAQGKPGLAVKLAENPLLRNEYRNLFYKIEGLLNQNNAIDKFTFAEELSKDETQLNLFFDILSLILKKRLHSQKESHRSEKSLKQTHHLFEKFLQTRYLVSRNVNKRLALENFFLQTES